MTRRELLAALPAVAMVGETFSTPAHGSQQGSDILGMTAVDLAAAIRRRDLSSRELMVAHLARVDALNPKFNAIVSRRDGDLLLREAAALDEEAAKGSFRGPLHGFPHAVKDTAAARGLAHTRGSPIFRNNVAEADSLVVARMRAAGAIFTGKTNVPEFALGSHSFNPIFGVTRNAYDPSRSAGGSSGGGAVALALRMMPLADGSDFGGSLRNPAAWNNVFGFRPSFGRVPSVPSGDVFGQTFATSGPMARTVRDTALLLSVQAGADPRAPFSLKEDPAMFATPLDRQWQGKRIGWLGDLGGALPMEPGVLQTCEKALGAFRDIGMSVEATTLAEPADAMWRTAVTLRHWSVGADLLPHADRPSERAMMKPEAIWEVDGYRKLSARDITEAQLGRTRIFEAFRRAFETFDFLVLPSAQVFPFDADLRWPTQIAGRTMDTYHRWMEVTLPVTMAGLPALSAPAGFGGPSNLPIGMQIIGPTHADLAVLQIGHAYEKASPWIGQTVPAAIRS
ncbi:amidase [Steroidobacter sp. S1-65]|uniref:Amidase n=1 Tax=Steroidobacter gossypii TaxID=2805490 RepID=A0ABS1X033_9GAMM|nr:amidase [Steroidobacter gossypii]MBM0106581.1 amidase [Steroidobacter gossypii]